VEKDLVHASIQDIEAHILPHLAPMQPELRAPRTRPTRTR
jgi:hypothetical protein